MCLDAHADGVPLLGAKGHPLSPVRPPAGEEPHADATDRPRSSFQRRPAKGIAFPKTRVSFTFTFALDRQDHSCTIGRARLLAHAAHTLSPSWGECFERALQASRGGHPLAVTFEGRAPC